MLLCPAGSAGTETLSKFVVQRNAFRGKRLQEQTRRRTFTGHALFGIEQESKLATGIHIWLLSKKSKGHGQSLVAEQKVKRAMRDLMSELRERR